MTPFTEQLPARVAALAALLVGGISLAASVDPWTCLLRAGIAFLVFGALGLGLRGVLHSGEALPPSANGRGRHFDATTPDDELVGENAEEAAEESAASKNDPS